MDLQMPVMDGYVATQKVRQWEAANQRPQLPIIALTADAFEEDRQHCLSVGMNDFLTKPITMDALATAIARWLPRANPKITLPLMPKLNPVDAQALSALVTELMPLLEQNKFDAVSRFHKLRALTTGTSLAGEVIAMEALLHDMRFDLVLERLRQITVTDIAIGQP
jgi:DNA-binding response OmpR family regulator